ncbi:MAG: DNA replication protein [Alphaproteobacteria bacterium]|nr:MAG: DNA replication protein [Alphaproteobacteria bacterium]
MPPVQIPFDIPVRVAFEAEDYLVTASNEAAVQWIDRWPDWNTTHCTILYGTPGCGKTHLSHVWQHKSGARLVDLATVNLPGNACSLIIENVDVILEDPGMQEKLFHLYNWQKEKGGTLMLTADKHPKHWQLDLPDLRSRMLASMAIEIGPPDDDLLAAVIVKQFMDRQIMVPLEVVTYLMARIERSFEAARDIVAKIDQLALSQKRKITIPLVRHLLDD